MSYDKVGSTVDERLTEEDIIASRLEGRQKSHDSNGGGNVQRAGLVSSSGSLKAINDRPDSLTDTL